MKRRVLLVVGAAISLAFGCAEIYGLGDYSQQEGGVDSGGGDGFIEASIFDVASDVLLGSDGGCAAMCAPPLPGGWTPIGYDQAFRPSCAADYGSPVDIAEGLSAGPATCGCSCNLTTPACSSLLVTAGDGGTNSCNNQSSQSVTWDGGCVVLTSTIQAQSAKMSVTASGSATCTPDASVVKPAVTYAYQGRMCQLLAASSAGCEGGVCVATPAPYTFCVYQAGVVACPSGYPVQHLIGTQPDDSRGCTACTCSSDGGACGGSATVYSGATCNATSQAINADGTCQSVSNQNFKSMTYQPTSAATCTPSTVTATGDAGFADPQTICCVQ